LSFPTLHSIQILILIQMWGMLAMCTFLLYFIKVSVCHDSTFNTLQILLVFLSTCLQVFGWILNVHLCHKTYNLDRYTLYAQHNMTITTALFVLFSWESIRCIDTTKRFLIWTYSTRKEPQRANNTTLVLGKKKGTATFSRDLPLHTYTHNIHTAIPLRYCS
jgi:hypothetical protein